MLRSMLLVLDESPSSEAARDLAIHLATRFEARLSALAVLDRSHITAPAAMGIGGIAYKRHRDDVKLEEAREAIRTLEQSCREAGERAGVAIELLEREGTPHEQIERASIRHDLIVCGKDADCHYDFEPNPADTAQQLLEDNPRPVLLCPATVWPTDGPLLAAFDGSNGASRAMHMLALLGFADGRPVHVLTVDEDEDKARHLAERATMLLALHGAEATAHGLVGDDEAEAILAQIEALQASRLVMGAYSGNRLRDWLLGSTTRTLINTCPVPLLVYH